MSNLRFAAAAVKSLTAAALTAALAAGAAFAQATDLTEGEVRKIDRDAARITLKHGELKALDMPAMTMVFAVRDKAMLDKLSVGDKIRFRAVSENGRYVVVEVQAVK